MSIASEFDSTIENLKSDYEGLENLGADLTNVNKNIQNIRTCLDNIYSSLPKTTGEGSNLSLSPTLKGKLNIEAYKGDTSQESTTGYNILNFNSYVALEDNILSTNSNRGQVLASDIQLQANTTYYFKFILIQKPTTSTTITSYIDGTPDTTIGQSNIQGYSVGTLVTKQITPTSNCVLSMAIWGNANTETIKFQYWLTTDNTKDTFEPYTNGASPNPTYPQDINVVTGTQEVVVSNKNKLPSGESGTYTSSGATHTSNGKGVYTINGTATGTSFHNFQIAPYTIKSGDYLYLGNSTANGNVAIALLVSGSEQIMFRSCSTANAIQDLSSYAGKVVNYVRTFTNAQTLSNFELKPMICNLSTQTDYVEHQEQTQQLRLGDIELAKIGSYVDRIYKEKDKWYLEKNTGKVVLNGSENWQQAGSVVSGTARYFYGNNDVYRDTNPNSTTIYVASNKFKGMYWNAIYTIDTTSLNGIANYNNAGGTGRIVIRMDDNSISPLTNNVENFKTWLSTHNTIVYYVLATSTITEITDTTLIEELNELEKMMSYDGQTNISISGNLPMIINVSALKGE